MTFTIEEMQKRFRKFGTIYSGEDIREDVEDIIGLEDKKEMMADFFLSLKKYIDIAANLKAAKIAPNFTMLLYGPPGTGKTALTRAMAKKYGIPMGLVDADRLVSPLLGDTVKNIIEKHGGNIKIKSEEGKGTNVIFTLPIKQKPQA